MNTTAATEQTAVHLCRDCALAKVTPRAHGVPSVYCTEHKVRTSYSMPRGCTSFEKQGFKKKGGEP